MAERFFALEAQQLRLDAGRAFGGKGMLAARAGIGAQASLRDFAPGIEAPHTPPAILRPSPPVPPLSQSGGHAPRDALKAAAFFPNVRMAA